MGPDSDFDLLVIVHGPVHRGRVAERIHMAFLGLGVPIDVVVATPEDVARAKGAIGSIVAPAWEEGREIYAA
jgi:predicted nucleotidyltransferase